MAKERAVEGCETAHVKASYNAPKILWTEKLTARAVECMRADASCAPGPIQS
jgi:hypothetical protein